MQFRLAVAVALIMVIITAPSTSLADTEWELVSEKDGITQYRRLLPDSPIYQFKGVALIHSRIEVIGEVLKDAESYPEWISGCEKTEILEDGFDNKILHYTHDFPWPVSDRDVVLNAKINRDFKNGLFIVDTKSLPGETVPIKEGLVRMPKMESQYIVKFISREKTRVTYTIHVEPGGSLSPALVNSNMRNLTYKNLKGLQKMAVKPIYTLLAEKSGETAAVAAAIQNTSLGKKTK